MLDIYCVYALVSTGMHRPFYIGATCNPKKREEEHRKRFGPDFTLVVLERRPDPGEIARLETELIAWYLERGVPLCNRALKSAYRGHRNRRPAIAKWKDNRLKKIARRERQLRLEAEGMKCREILAGMVADGSADRLATAFLATQKALLAATDEEAAKIAAAYFSGKKDCD